MHYMRVLVSFMVIRSCCGVWVAYKQGILFIIFDNALSVPGPSLVFLEMILVIFKQSLLLTLNFLVQNEIIRRIQSYQLLLQFLIVAEETAAE
jgi:hypothetical protein